ncbi:MULTISPECIES: universal stress protein [Arthrobacter]|uniref:Universal stress protein n=1 Tax=Arthrobacter terricola TaxID=2547396 RepID=A0A4R5KYY3_9MICC|nr:MULTISPECIES: universal stress protein [Arthrobacter]MBT8159543.1 universal stress protein [Arthrobacter sp. GN70]TDG01332.1 universal stress protein [Arthrobacter terricola]
MTDNGTATTTDVAESDSTRAAGRPGSRIVVGVDGSDGSLAAVHWAVGEARLRGVRLHLVMAWQYPQYYGATDGWGLGVDPSGDSGTILARAADTEITRLGKEAGEGQNVAITWEAVEGHPAEVLVRTGKDAAMVVVGSHGHGGFVGALLGSVSQHVVAHARCPVVLIPDPSQAGIPS